MCWSAASAESPLKTLQPVCGAQEIIAMQDQWWV